MTKFNYTCFKSPFGWVVVAGSNRGIARIMFGASSEAEAERQLLNEMQAVASPSGLSEAVNLLTRYFNGMHVHFNLELDLSAGTNFQIDAWRKARQIPYGTVQSYGWIAREIGKPNAARAVGQAMGANPLSIIVPCHRVVRSDGELGGFARGLTCKRQLLELERKTQDVQNNLTN
ncbi:MAG: methylated-DNA--[protein]-cysteine S-methyltransferase [Candidatus Poribacteria bacterium]|nr:methylated-DNA--[protein]-cysteine S-methyltransferase [Candidatus Poribacteria bacterium]